MRGICSRLVAAAAIAVAASLVPRSAWVDGGDEFYQGRTITIVVGSTAGGGYDLYATPKDIVAKAARAMATP